MRQIKFRAQDIASNKWLYGDLRHHKDDVCIFEQGGEKGEQVKRDTVGLFTGVCDMDGKEIYEGDVLVIEGIKTDRYSKVWWNNERFTFYVGLSPISAYLLENGRLKNFRVAGNIYDNPELKEKLV